MQNRSFVASLATAIGLVLVWGLANWLGNVGPTQVARATGLIDTTLSDFTDPGASTNCYVSPSSSDQTDGEIVLSPTVGTDFPGTALPSDWVSSTAGVATVSNGWLLVNEGGAGTANYFTPGRVFEFEALFSAVNLQHAGFAINLSSDPNFAIFSSDGTELRARTSSSLSSEAASLGSGYFGAAHRYRIEWRPSSVNYYIDGTWVATHTVDIAVSMHPAFQDFNDGVTSLQVDWARMGDYSPSSCTFTSRVVDSGVNGSSFNGLSTTLNIPLNTEITFEIITSTDNSLWNAWIPVNGDGTFISSTARYLRYRATMTTTDALLTPEIRSVQVRGFGPPPTAVRLTTLMATASGFGSREIVVGLITGLLAVGGIGAVVRRRKRDR